jgi:hypothetical protein
VKTVTGRPAHSASAPSSGKEDNPAAAAARCAASRSARRKIWGVWTALKLARSGVSTTRPFPSTTLIVSATGSAGMAAALAIPAAMARSIRAWSAKGPRPVVDENAARAGRRGGGKRFKAVPNGFLAHGTTSDGRPKLASGVAASNGRGLVQRPILGTDHDLDRIDRRVRQEHVQCPRQHGATRQIPVLLRPVAADPRSAPAGDDNGGHRHRGLHRSVHEHVAWVIRVRRARRKRGRPTPRGSCPNRPFWLTFGHHERC